MTTETRNLVMKVRVTVIWLFTEFILFSPFIVYLMNDDYTISLSIFLQATLGFFALPNEPSDVVNPLIDNLITLLCAILVTRYSVC